MNAHHDDTVMLQLLNYIFDECERSAMHTVDVMKLAEKVDSLVSDVNVRQYIIYACRCLFSIENLKSWFINIDSADPNSYQTELKRIFEQNFNYASADKHVSKKPSPSIIGMNDVNNQRRKKLINWFEVECITRASPEVVISTVVNKIASLWRRDFEMQNIIFNEFFDIFGVGKYGHPFEKYDPSKHTYQNKVSFYSRLHTAHSNNTLYQIYKEQQTFKG